MLNKPDGTLSLNRDQLRVCNFYNGNILLIRPSTSSMTVLLDKQHGIESPLSIGFCKEWKKLYVAPNGKMILVYQLSWWVCARNERETINAPKKVDQMNIIKLCLY